jgi:anti-sigma-K factor RskA
MSDHEELESSVAAWVLGALDPDEAESMRLHADGCATCTEVAGRLRRVVGALPLTVDEVAPPPRLRERVLAAATARGSAARPVAVRPPRRRVLPRRPLPRLPLYAVAAIAVIALLTGVFVDRTFYGPPVTPGPQAAHFTLSGHQEMSGAQATVIDLRTDGLALIDFRGLPPLAAGRVYEVWLIRSGGGPEPVAVFVPDSNGAKVVLVNRSLAGYSVMAVTNEPGPDGSPAPTQQPQLYGNVA